MCSTGRAGTPTVIGEYEVFGKGYSFGHGYTCYYYTQFYGDYLFHSSPYYVNSNRIMDPTMARSVIGRVCASGNSECKMDL